MKRHAAVADLLNPDDPIDSEASDFLNDFDADELEAQDSVSTVCGNGAGGSVALDKQSSSVAEPPPQQPFVMVKTVKDLLVTCLTGENADPSNSNYQAQSSYLRDMNTKQLQELDMSTANPEVMQQIADKLDQKLDIELPLGSAEETWSVLGAINPRRLDDIPELQDSLRDMQTSLKTVEKFWAANEPVPEMTEIELHAACNKFFKTMIVNTLGNSKKRKKHVIGMLNERTLMLLETRSPHLRLTLKKSLNLSINDGLNTQQKIDKRNPMFNLDGYGVVVANTREAKGKTGTFRSFVIEENCQTYLTQQINELFSERLPLVQMFSPHIFFNVVQAPDVPNVSCLDRNKLKTMDDDTYLLHVKFGGAPVQQSRVSPHLYILNVTLYVNYVLASK